MANPLAILAGLATTGAQAGAGAFEGQVLGEDLRRRYESQDIENQLRSLRAILAGQEIQRGTQPTYSVQGGRQIMMPPVGAPTITELPETASERALREEREARAAREKRQAEAPAKGPTLAEEKGGIVREYLRLLQTEGPERAQAWLNNTLAKIHAAEAKGTAPHVSTHYATDAQGNVTQIITRTDPVTGQTTTERQPLGAIGKRERPSAALTPRETVETGTRIIPRKDINATTDPIGFGKLVQALPQIVDEIAGSPKITGWNQPGPTVRVEGYPGPVRREDVIRHAFKKRTGVDVAVRWDGRQWVLDRAWIPTSKEVIEKKRVTGPPAPSRDETGEEEEE